MLRRLALLAVVVALGLLAYAGYERYVERYAVERDDGLALTKVVAATFTGASALKVGELSGTVQASAADTRGFGLLRSDHVFKAPFTAAYFVDVSRLSAADFEWDAGNRLLTIRAPDVTVARADVDESRRSLTRTGGLFVTRAAMDELARRSSAAAQRTAQVEAEKPERVARARDNAREALARMLRAPLAAAGLGDVRVRVRFPIDPVVGGEPSDRSRSLQDVLSDPRYAP